jgi:hypothetical protein
VAEDKKDFAVNEYMILATLNLFVPETRNTNFEST